MLGNYNIETVYYNILWRQHPSFFKAHFITRLKHALYKKKVINIRLDAKTSGMRYSGSIGARSSGNLNKIQTILNS